MNKFTNIFLKKKYIAKWVYNIFFQQVQLYIYIDLLTYWLQLMFYIVIPIDQKALAPTRPPHRANLRSLRAVIL